jgi:hypothetical protein
MPRREAARIRDIYGIGHRQPAYGFRWQVAAGVSSVRGCALELR